MSYSDIVEIVQNDKEVGVSMIKEFAKTLKDKSIAIDLAKAKVKELENDFQNDLSGIQHICKHLKLEYPISVRVDDKIITCMEGNFSEIYFVE